MIRGKVLFLLIAWFPSALLQLFSEPPDVGGSLTEVSGGVRFEY